MTVAANGGAEHRSSLADRGLPHPKPKPARIAWCSCWPPIAGQGLVVRGGSPLRTFRCHAGGADRTFARISVVVAMHIEDYFPNVKRSWVRLQGERWQASWDAGAP
jgi:hypothetical protein